MVERPNNNKKKILRINFYFEINWNLKIINEKTNIYIGKTMTREKITIVIVEK